MIILFRMNDYLSFKIIKYALVGLSGVAVDFSATWIAKEKIKLNKYLANSIGFALAVTSNYLLNRYWTFNDFEAPIGPQYLKFIIISVVGLGLNNLFLYLLVKKLRTGFYFSKLLVLVLIFLWNYTANYFYTFHP